MKNILDQEVSDLNEFPDKIDYYSNAVTVFNTYAVNARRQRALQIEINLRKLRLEALRSLRLQTMMEAKQRQIDADKQVCVCSVCGICEVYAVCICALCVSYCVEIDATYE